jgi:hypothetical protein
MLSVAVVLAIQALTAAPAPQADLRSLFETPSEVTVAANGMMIASAPMHMVALARVAADGSIEIICVESNEGAQNFLRKQQTVDTSKAQEK